MMFMLKTIGCDSSQMVYIPQVLKINCFFLHTRDGDYQGETWQKICRERSCLGAKPASWYRLIKTVPHGPLCTALMSQVTVNFEQRALGKKKQLFCYLSSAKFLFTHTKNNEASSLNSSRSQVSIYSKMVASLAHLRVTANSLLVIWCIGLLQAHASLPPGCLFPWNFHFSSN